MRAIYLLVVLFIVGTTSAQFEVANDQDQAAVMWSSPMDDAVLERERDQDPLEQDDSEEELWDEWDYEQTPGPQPPSPPRPIEEDPPVCDCPEEVMDETTDPAPRRPSVFPILLLVLGLSVAAMGIMVLDHYHSAAKLLNEPDPIHPELESRVRVFGPEGFR